MRKILEMIGLYGKSRFYLPEAELAARFSRPLIDAGQPLPLKPERNRGKPYALGTEHFALKRLNIPTDPSGSASTHS